MHTDNMGTFYVTRNLEEAVIRNRAENTTFISMDNEHKITLPESTRPTVFSASGDLEKVLAGELSKKRIKILMEHGVGITFDHPSYAGGKGVRSQVDMFLAPNKYICDKTFSAYPNAEQAIIGTPKLDKWRNAFWQYRRPSGKKPVVAISFQIGRAHV